MHIGLIGGIGPGATDYYYRRLIAAFKKSQKPLELTMVHADAPTLLGNLAENNVAAQVAIFSKLTERLAAAGASCVVVTAIAGHFCINEFTQVSPLPVVNMIEALNAYVTKHGYKRVGLLGTQKVMETRFYGGITAEVVPPEGEELVEVHTSYVTMAASGQVTEEQRAVFARVSNKLLQDAGAEAIILGGTDLAMVYNEKNSPFPVIDCAAIHADAIIERAGAQP